jgi:hypothetical protein
LANIEEVFLRKAGSRGEVGDDDVVAYFIECSNGDEAEMVDEKKRENRNASLDACSTVVDNDVACNIEYLNKKTLRKNLGELFDLAGRPLALSQPTRTISLPTNCFALLYAQASSFSRGETTRAASSSGSLHLMVEVATTLKSVPFGRQSFASSNAGGPSKIYMILGSPYTSVLSPSTDRMSIACRYRSGEQSWLGE